MTVHNRDAEAHFRRCMSELSGSWRMLVGFIVGSIAAHLGTVWWALAAFPVMLMAHYAYNAWQWHKIAHRAPDHR